MSKTTTASIYGLLDPETWDLRYIGKAVNPDARFAGHMRDSRRRDTPVYRWIRKLSMAGARPDMIVLAANCQDWRASERRLIAEARQTGMRLLNVADGGDEPLCPVEIRRENGRKHTFQMLPSRGGMDTRETLIFDTYSRLLDLCVAQGRSSLANRLKQEMTGLATERPEHFGAWI